MTTTKQTGLLPFPFCGGEPLLQEHPAHSHGLQIGDWKMPDHPGSWTVECCACNCGMVNNSLDDLTKDWNTRAQSAPEPVQGEAVRWRALLRTDQRPAMLNDKHVVGFTSLQAAESWVAEKKDFQGWDYAIEPLYTAAAKPDAELVALLRDAKAALDPFHRDVCELRARIAAKLTGWNKP